MKTHLMQTAGARIRAVVRAEFAALPSIIYLTALTFLFPLMMYVLNVGEMRTVPGDVDMLAVLGFLLLYPAAGSFLILNLWREQAVRERRRHLHLALPIRRREVNRSYFTMFMLAFLPNALMVLLAWLAYGHGVGSLPDVWYLGLLGLEWLLLSLFLIGYTIWKRKRRREERWAGLFGTMVVVFLIFTINSGTLQHLLATFAPWIALLAWPLGLWLGWRAASFMADIE